ncbi:hypothetical protein DMN91_007118 [Ooceraea biroi]|uniref:HTH cro/C1-type domain-containing protein n=1 Tax=Ooceraea biroi TaxID=2015173 RepID=A0A3L8DKZ5_OOCBI|nr:hypothetical protein DMN91_007118 [Ooceraea biroi]
MSDWDTAPITLRKRAPKSSTLKTEKAVNDARRQGFTVETQAKCEYSKFSCASSELRNFFFYKQKRSIRAVRETCGFTLKIFSGVGVGGGGANRQHVTTKNTAKLDRETEELKHDQIPLELGKLIQQGRQSKGLSQKDLATKVNEKAQVINDYEAGRGIPNQMVIGKIERVLGLKLRGKDRGKPLAAPGTKK